MRCISPLLIRTSGRRDFVPCGKCNFCLQVKRADWTFRLSQEYKRAYTSAFLTLTYEGNSESVAVTDGQLRLGNLPVSQHGEAELCKRDLQLFTKRLRKENEKRVDWPLRYYSVGEYGTVTDRPHYHSILFNLDYHLYARLTDIWQMGNVHVGDVSPASIHYVTKYVINRTGDFGGREPPFAMMSKRPGIGKNYLETHTQWHRNDMRNYVQVNGKIGRLPRYYKDKIFSQYERTRLAAQAIQVGDEAYLEEVSRLSRFHDDPYHYYDERVTTAHNVVKSKANTLNKF